MATRKNLTWMMVAACVGILAVGLVMANLWGGSQSVIRQSEDVQPDAQWTEDIPALTHVTSRNVEATVQAASYPQFSPVNANLAQGEPVIQLCQACLPCGPRPLCGVQCGPGCYCDGHEPHWHDQQELPFDIYGHGE